MRPVGEAGNVPGIRTVTTVRIPAVELRDTVTMRLSSFPRGGAGLSRPHAEARMAKFAGVFSG